MEVEVNDSNFKEEVLNSELFVLVDFWAPWCGPCNLIAPIIEEIARHYEGKIKVCKLNVDKSPTATSEYEIMSIPTLAIFKNGEVVDKIIGAVSKSVLENKINSYISTRT